MWQTVNLITLFEDPSPGIEIAEGIKVDYHRNRAFNSLAIAFGYHGKIDQALGCFEKMSKDKNTSYSSKIVAQMCLKKGLLDKYIEIVEGIKDDFDRNMAYDSLATAFSLKGKIDQALGCIQKMRKDKEHYWTSKSSINVAEACLEEGLLDKYPEITKMITIKELLKRKEQLDKQYQELLAKQKETKQEQITKLDEID